ncbi:MAG TPA: carbon-nitrogen hydrolase family protein [Anaerolineales bacterium]|nr:carbon-nitrogen hydrolase family protein [Anaerolineales bacterium]
MTYDLARPAVALVQMNCVLEDKTANLKKTGDLLSGLNRPVDIACLPELFSTAYNLEALGERIFELAEPVPEGETIQTLSALAREHDLAIVAGIIEQVPAITGIIYDTVVLLNRRGEFVGRYRKSHLYPAEHRYFRPGDDLPVFDLDGLRVGVAICFEAAFAPIFTTLALRGAQIVFNPSAVPVGFAYLQDLRTPARAQDNQYFVAATNHVGVEGDVTYCGRSQVADPKGEIIALAPTDQEGVFVAELDLELIHNQRLQEPIVRGFRPELYQFAP